MSIFDKMIEFDRNEYEKAKNPEKDVNKKIAKAESKYYIRTMGDPQAILEAQRIFNPGMPPTQPRGPLASQVEKGIAGAINEGGWGEGGMN